MFHTFRRLCAREGLDKFFFDQSVKLEPINNQFSVHGFTMRIHHLYLLAAVLAGDCEDKTPAKCRPFMCKQTGAKVIAYVKVNCKKTCSLCSGESGKVTTSRADTCVDTTPNVCKLQAAKCQAEKPKVSWFMKKNCKNTCKFCGSNSEVSEKENSSKDSECRDLKPTWCRSKYRMVFLK